MARLKQEVLELQVKHGELKAERKQLLQQRKEKESQGAQQQSEIGQVRLMARQCLSVMLFFTSTK